MSTVLYNRTSPVARITINRPEAMNAFDLATARELGRRLEQFDRDAKLRVAILTGAPEVLGRKAYRSLRDLPESVDLAVVLVRSDLVPWVVADARIVLA